MKPKRHIIPLIFFSHLKEIKAGFYVEIWNSLKVCLKGLTEKLGYNKNTRNCKLCIFCRKFTFNTKKDTINKKDEYAYGKNKECVKNSLTK